MVRDMVDLSDLQGMIAPNQPYASRSRISRLADPRDSTRMPYDYSVSVEDVFLRYLFFFFFWVKL